MIFDVGRKTFFLLFSIMAGKIVPKTMTRSRLFYFVLNNCKLQHFDYFCCLEFKTINMATAIRISDKLVKEARLYSKVDQRSLTRQIEHWAKIGKCAEQNPDLTYSLIKDILFGMEEMEQGEFSDYTFE